MSRRYHLLIPLLLALAGCAEAEMETGGAPSRPAGGNTPGPVDSLPDSVVGNPERNRDPEWTLATVQGGAGSSGVATQVEMRVAPNEGFDRIVLEFEDSQLPRYRIGFAEPPIVQCASGEVMSVAGAAYLEIHLEPAQAHDEQGRTTLPEWSLPPSLTVIRDLQKSCEFEAHLDWVVGLPAARPFRVMELDEPSRLVIDLEE